MDDLYTLDDLCKVLKNLNTSLAQHQKVRYISKTNTDWKK